MRSGRTEGLPYSLSRWTDVPVSKWPIFLEALKKGSMIAFDPRNAIPYEWSLDPVETLGLVFWTKNPANIVKDYALLKPFKMKVHVTITGWTEEERGVPSPTVVCMETIKLAKLLGKENVVWRFSPVPLVDDSLIRFHQIAACLKGSVDRVYLSFLQPNDLIPETRDAAEKLGLMVEMAEVAKRYGMQVILCNEDSMLRRVSELPENLSAGVCAPPEDFALPGFARPPSEGCGCVLMADPFTVNETCTMGCSYCLEPSTPVLYSDMVWRPIGEARVGDSLVGFDEFPTPGVGARKARRMRETIIEAVSGSKQPTIRMITGQSDIVTTTNHGWINDRGKWLSTGTLWGHGPMRTKLRQIGQVKDLPFTEEYKLGYLAAMALGDGTMRYQPGQRSDKLGFPQAYWRVALKDEEPLGRLIAYLASFGVEANIRPFDPGPNSKTTMQKVEIRALGRLSRIQELLAMQPDSPEYRRGFLAGFYDAEGGVGGSNLRVSQKDRSVLRRVGDYASRFGFNLYTEPHSEGSVAGTARLGGALRERMRFISSIRPAIARKFPDWLGLAFEADADPVMCKEKAGLRDVVDIQTSTHTFFAAGLATHNCYAADKTLAPKKRNTTRHLTVLP